MESIAELAADRNEALLIADDLALIAEVYGTTCRDHVRRALAANPHLHWQAVIDLTLTEWERVERAPLRRLAS